MKSWFCWWRWNRGAKILQLIPRLFQPFRLRYLRITHFERLCLRMTHSFQIAQAFPTPVVGGLPSNVTRKLHLSSICNPAQHSSGHGGETCLCVYVFVRVRRENSRVERMWWGSFAYVAGRREAMGRTWPLQLKAFLLLDTVLTLWFHETAEENEGWRKRLPLSNCQILNMILEPRKLLSLFFPTQNSARPFLLALCEYLRDLVVAVFSSPKQDLALLWARGALKMLFTGSSVTESACWRQ